MEDFRTFVYELTAQALPPEIRMDSEMMDISAPAVMTAENRSDYVITRIGDKAHPRVAVEISPDIFPGIRSAQPHSLALFPKGRNLVI